MIRPPKFALVPIDRLRAHEEIDERDLERLAEKIRRAGVFADPIWVARGSFVILNGHHRVAALRRLGAKRVPAWLLDYEADYVALEPWQPGRSVSKAEVVVRGRDGRLYPPKTTRHRVEFELPPHPTPLAELLDGPAARAQAPPRAGARRPRAGASRSG